MTPFVALLRAVNVGGTGKLLMTDLAAIAAAAGLRDVRTYIASGNVVCSAEGDEAAVKAALEAGLHAHVGAPVGVLVRTATEMVEIVAANPFKDAPGNRVSVIFLDEPTSSATLNGVTGAAAEETLRLGRREIYVHYGQGQATTKLRIPAASCGTARNMNTVAKLAAMVQESAFFF